MAVVGAHVRPVAVFIPDVNETGGTERATVQCIRRWALERDVHVFTRSASAPLPSNVSVHTVRLWRSPQLVGWLLFVLWSGVKAQQLRRRSDFITFSPGINLVGSDVTVAHIYYRHTEEVLRASQARRQRISLRSIHSRAYQFAVRSLEPIHFAKARFVFAVSPWQAKAMEANGIDVYGLAPNGVDLAEFPIRNPRWGPRLRVLSVGSEIGKKGLDLLVDAACKPAVRERVEVSIVTRAQNSEPLLAQAKSCGFESLSVHTNLRAAAELFTNCDVYVAGSREDSFNMPALEAMASGIPVVMTDQCGLAGWISDEALITAPTSTSIGEALSALVDDAAMFERLASQGRRFATAFTWDATADVVAQAFRVMDGEKSAGGAPN